MDKLGRFDCSRLLGFSVLNEQNMGRVDFQAETFGAKLGAKVGGTEADGPQKTNKLDLNKLLGFEGVGEKLSGSVDFQDETMNAKLGAKVGVELMA